MAVSAAMGRVLRACVRGEPGHPIDPPARWRRADYHGLADAAWFHGIAGYAHARLRGADWLPAEELAALEELRHGAVHGHLQALSGLARLRDVLDPAGIDWVVVKGPVLSETLHGSPALRAYGDLDVLVPADQIEAALDLLVRDGGRPLVRSWAALGTELSGELQVRLPTGLVADLHWHLLSRRSLRESFRVPTRDLLARRRPVDLGAASVATLGPIDTLAHLCLHTMLSGGNRLVWLKDIERAVSCGALDWEEVRQRAAQWRAQLIVGAALGLARRVLGAPVPPEVIESLAPRRGWRGVVVGATRLSPVERGSPGGSLGRIVCRATRATSAASCAELARRSAAFARDAAAGALPTRAASYRPEPDPEDADARRAFFAAVAAAADE